MTVVLLTNLAVVAFVLGVTFLVGERLRRHNVVDVAWGLAFTLVAVTSALLGGGDSARNWLIAVLVTAWGLRLSVYLGVRSLGHGEDPRYEALLAKSRRSRVVAIISRVYLLQGFLIWFISLPIQLSSTSTRELPWWSAIGVGLWLVGFFFEAVGDAQLRAFKLDRAHAGQVMDRGLWRYTRHPNYFGEACMWWGLFVIAVTAGPLVLLGIASPIVLTVLLVRVSGKDLLERHLADRPGYAEYIRRTPGFIPGRPR
ncbi:MAG: DUF1295 domain-containing protein [Nocardiaceae bacterium]|nr:DUF1295 domain-containing protein [Nocardiaceae bacterium]